MGIAPPARVNPHSIQIHCKWFTLWFIYNITFLVLLTLTESCYTVSLYRNLLVSWDLKAAVLRIFEDSRTNFFPVSIQDWLNMIWINPDLIQIHCKWFTLCNSSLTWLFALIILKESRSKNTFSSLDSRLIKYDSNQPWFDSIHCKRITLCDFSVTFNFNRKLL